jgi:Transposase DNA-binding/Transposase DDE domain
VNDTQSWAQRQFGSVEVGDVRRTAGIVTMAANIARQASASLPQQMQDWSGQRAAYRLLAQEAVSHAALSQPHWQQTRQQAALRGGTVLWVHDISEMDYSAHPATRGLGPIGDPRGRGWLTLSSWAVTPQRQGIGLGYQQVWTRPLEKVKSSRRARARQPDAPPQRWRDAVAQLGTPPPETRWVHVADREADDFAFFVAARTAGADFCVRLKSNRRLVADVPTYLLDQVRRWTSQGALPLHLPAQGKRKARQTQLALSWGQVTLQPPGYHAHLAPLTAWALRVWEAAPPDGETRVEGLLLTSVPVTSLSAAQARLGWYSCRWIIEEYHSCLKTGCQMQARRLQTGQSLQRLFGIVAIVAVRLLQLRDWSRSPQRPALEVIAPLLVQVMAQRLQRPLKACSGASFGEARLNWRVFRDANPMGNPVGNGSGPVGTTC